MSIIFVFLDGVGLAPAGPDNPLTDADTLVNSSKTSTYVSELAFWSTNRDNGSCAGATSASPACSGVAQTTFAYANKFKLFNQ